MSKWLKTVSAMCWWLSQGPGYKPGSPTMCSSGSQKSTKHRLPDHLHSVSGSNNGSPLAWMLGERGVTAASPPPQMPAMLFYPVLQYLPLPVSNTLWTSRMACCEQTCLLSTQEFPGFALRQARRFPPGKSDVLFWWDFAEFSGFRGSLYVAFKVANPFKLLHWFFSLGYYTQQLHMKGRATLTLFSLLWLRSSIPWENRNNPL